MGLSLQQPDVTTIPPKPHPKTRWLLVVLYFYVFLTFTFLNQVHYSDQHRAKYYWHIAFASIAVVGSLLGIAIEIFSFSVVRRVVSPLYLSHHWFPITEPPIEKRVRSRYSGEMKELEAVGFSPLLFLGESKSIVSFLFILPALTDLMMRLHGEVMTRSGWFTNVRATIVLANKEEGAYAEPIGLGVVFRTKLKNGTVIATDNFGEDFVEGKKLRFAHKGASITTLWDEHRAAIRRSVDTGSPVSMETSSESYIGFFSKRPPNP